MSVKLVRELIRKVEARGAKPARFCCSHSIAVEIACELESFEEINLLNANTARIFRGRRKRGEAPLQHGDRIFGVAVDQVFPDNGGGAGLAWVSS